VCCSYEQSYCRIVMLSVARGGGNVVELFWNYFGTNSSKIVPK